MPSQLDAKSAHERLRCALVALRDAERNAVTLFAEIMERRLYRELGYATIHLYASEALGFSRSKTFEFIRLAESMRALPRLKAGLESGQVSWTKAREIVKVATPRTERQWIEIAESSSRRSLEKQVQRSRARRGEAKRNEAKRDPRQGELPIAGNCADPEPPPAAPMQSTTLRFDPMQRARFDTMIEKLRKRFRCSREEAVLRAMDSTLSQADQSTRVDSRTSVGGEITGMDSRTPKTHQSTRVDSGAPYQVIVHRCESCSTSSLGAERLALSAAESAQVDCDAQIVEAGKRNRRSIPPSRRREVLLRDGHRCRVRGCGSTSFLEVHHLQPRSEGGSNRAENLITLCSTCHRHLHERGSAPPLRELGGGSAAARMPMSADFGVQAAGLPATIAKPRP